jgi:hypothetical protein
MNENIQSLMREPPQIKKNAIFLARFAIFEKSFVVAVSLRK